MQKINTITRKLLKIQEEIQGVVSTVADLAENEQGNDNFIVIRDELFEVDDKLAENCEFLLKTKRGVEL